MHSDLGATGSRLLSKVIWTTIILFAVLVIILFCLFVPEAGALPSNVRTLLIDALIGCSVGTLALLFVSEVLLLRDVLARNNEELHFTHVLGIFLLTLLFFASMPYIQYKMNRLA
jgi:hypothetical protein